MILYNTRRQRVTVPHDFINDFFVGDACWAMNPSPGLVFRGPYNILSRRRCPPGIRLGHVQLYLI
jgi:hypothetical protein